MDGKSVFLLLVGCMLFAACEKPPASSAAQSQNSTPAQSVATPSASAGSPSPIAVSGGAGGNAEYEKVAARLDAGGVAYFYWNGQKIFGELGNVFGPVAEAALSEPGLTSGDKELVRKYLDLAGRCTRASGIDKIKAFGFSSKGSEPGVFLNKSYLYVPDREGILWETFAKSPHDLTELNMVPAKAEAFAFYEFDLPLLWRAIVKELESSNIPEAARWGEQISRQVQTFVGLPLEELLDSLADQIGVIVTLDAQRIVEIPLGGRSCKLPAPAAALIWKIRNEKLFDRLDALMKLNPKVQVVDEADLKLRVIKGMTELPFVSPAVAMLDEYLIFSTSEEIVHAVVDAKRGKEPGIKSNPDFARLAAGMPQQGNCVAYTSKSFQKSLADLQIKLSEMQETQSPLLEAITAKVALLSADISSYSVGSAVEDGWLAYARTTKDVNEVLGTVVSLPAYYVALAAIEYTKETRQAGRLSKIKENLANLQAAKDEAASEKNFETGQMLTRQDIEEYLPSWPDSVVGESYEVGVVGQPPYATAPVDLGSYPAGTKIEP